MTDSKNLENAVPTQSSFPRSKSSKSTGSRTAMVSQPVLIKQPPPRRRKTSSKNSIDINHLLEYESYSDLLRFSGSHHRPARNRPPQKKSFPRIILKGMSYINVHYKFVVDPSHSYSMHTLDPNLPVDMDRIINVICPVGNKCPICLSETPVAPRMIMSCGHVICLKCVLSLISTTVPKAQKREAEAVVEKYRECPLCQSVIRLKELKPVVFNALDERFDTPKPYHDSVLTLMLRPHDSCLALPRHIDERTKNIGDFPVIRQFGDLVPFLRILKGDATHVSHLYTAEKQAILDLHAHEKVLYNEPSEYVDMAIQHIDKELASWHEQLNTTQRPSRVPTEGSKSRLQDSNFFYYQTGFNSSSVFVLSPLDMKVLKAAHQDQYFTLPSLVVAKVEHVRFEDLTTETALSKYKFLAHLPVGTSIGFLECDWRNHPLINADTWTKFLNDLTNRSNTSHRRFTREEKARVRALQDQEARTRDFFARENGIDSTNDDFALFAAFSLSDPNDLPTLANKSAKKPAEVVDTPQTRTVWGTVIPKADTEPAAEEEYDWDAEELIRKAHEELAKSKGRGKKKRIVLLSSN